MPANPAPTMPILSFSELVLPGPFWARAIRFSLRTDLFPICCLAASDLKSVSTGCGAVVDMKRDEEDAEAEGVEMGCMLDGDGRWNAETEMDAAAQHPTI
jgi:hypothetical protein